MITEQSTYNLHRWRRRVQIQVTVPPLARLGRYTLFPHLSTPCTRARYLPTIRSDALLHLTDGVDSARREACSVFLLPLQPQEPSKS